MTPPADVVGKLVEIARRLQLENPAPRRRARCPTVLDKQVLSDILECCLTPAYQVAWREGNSVLHREFKDQDDAAAFYESLGSTSRKRLTSHGREMCVSGLEGRGGWPLEWVLEHEEHIVKETSDMNISNSSSDINTILIRYPIIRPLIVTSKTFCLLKIWHDLVDWGAGRV
jgi:hypothetical protein